MFSLLKICFTYIAIIALKSCGYIPELLEMKDASVILLPVSLKIWSVLLIGQP